MFIRLTRRISQAYHLRLQLEIFFFLFYRIRMLPPTTVSLEVIPTASTRERERERGITTVFLRLDNSITCKSINFFRLNEAISYHPKQALISSCLSFSLLLSLPWILTSFFFLAWLDQWITWGLVVAYRPKRESRKIITISCIGNDHMGQGWISIEPEPLHPCMLAPRSRDPVTTNTLVCCGRFPAQRLPKPTNPISHPKTFDSPPRSFPVSIFGH